MAFMAKAVYMLRALASSVKASQRLRLVRLTLTAEGGGAMSGCDSAGSAIRVGPPLLYDGLMVPEPRRRPLLGREETVTRRPITIFGVLMSRNVRIKGLH